MWPESGGLLPQWIGSLIQPREIACIHQLPHTRRHQELQPEPLLSKPRRNRSRLHLQRPRDNIHLIVVRIDTPRRRIQIPRRQRALRIRQSRRGRIRPKLTPEPIEQRADGERDVEDPGLASGRDASPRTTISPQPIESNTVPPLGRRRPRAPRSCPA